MRNFLITLLFAVSSIIATSNQSFAQASGTTVVKDYSSTNIGITTWVPLITSTARAIKGISVMNGGAQILKMGIAGAGSTANTETTIITFPASMTTPVVFPVSFSGGYRISILANATISSGSGQFNFFY